MSLGRLKAKGYTIGQAWHLLSGRANQHWWGHLARVHSMVETPQLGLTLTALQPEAGFIAHLGNQLGVVFLGYGFHFYWETVTSRKMHSSYSHGAHPLLRYL